jgi:mRNA interferase RelE/StbE
MSHYSIEISPAAERDLKKLKGELLNFNKLIKIVDNLSIEPKPIGTRKIKGFQNTYRVRLLSYRIIYDVIEKDNTVIILRILKRDESTYKFK